MIFHSRRPSLLAERVHAYHESAFPLLLVRVGEWNGICCYSKGYLDIHFHKYGSALVNMTAL